MNIQPDPEILTAPVPKPRRSILSFQLFAVIFGISILSFVIYRAGYQTTLNCWVRLAGAFSSWLGRKRFEASIEGLFCVYLAIPNRPAPFKYRNAVAARLGGDAAGIITFTGMMVSEATKATLLKSRLSLHDSIVTIVVDNIVYDISVTFFDL